MSELGRPRQDDLAFVAQAAELWGADDESTGYLARVFAQTALPYRDPGDLPEWVRSNGSLSLIIQPGPATYDAKGRRAPIGYPYGTVPRLLLTWLSTEAVRTKQREFLLGESLSDFMRQLGMGTTAGHGGQITRLRSQMRRLFNARISIHYDETTGAHQREAARYLNVVTGYDLWWSTRQADQPALWPSSVTLSQEFYEEVTTRPMPLNLTALQLLSGSPMRLDLYTLQLADLPDELPAQAHHCAVGVVAVPVRQHGADQAGPPQVPPGLHRAPEPGASRLSGGQSGSRRARGPAAPQPVARQSRPTSGAEKAVNSLFVVRILRSVVT